MFFFLFFTNFDKNSFFFSSKYNFVGTVKIYLSNLAILSFKIGIIFVSDLCFPFLLFFSLFIIYFKIKNQPLFKIMEI